MRPDASEVAGGVEAGADRGSPADSPADSATDPSVAPGVDASLDGAPSAGPAIAGVPFAEVLAGAQEGDEQAWATLFNTYAGPLRGYLFSRGAQEPDDLLGEVFVDLARRLHAFSGSEAQFRSWLFMVAHNRVVDERRKRARRPTSPVDHTVFDVPSLHHDTEAEAVRHVMASEALTVIDSLTPDQRAVLRLRLVEGLTLEEVADRLDKPVGAVKALQRRGLAAAARARETSVSGGTQSGSADGNKQQQLDQDL